MEKFGHLPLLPSERKLRICNNHATYKQEISTSNASSSSSSQAITKSPATKTITARTSCSNDFHQKDDGVERKQPSSTPTDTDEIAPDTRVINDHQGQHQLSLPLDTILVPAREQQLDRLGSYPPLPVSTTSEYVLDYLSTTTEFMNKFQYQLSRKFDDCQEKIDIIDRMVGLLESKQMMLDKEGESALQSQTTYK
mmetsp:Transcript_11165/g.20905  ORF Transcript_11165/g.20905 Transcript_11165/m.20905 type:complete len:196 (-) Transcript_11165:140-727(-)